MHAVGARPVLVDLPGNWKLDPARLEAAIGPTTRGRSCLASPRRRRATCSHDGDCGPPRHRASSRMPPRPRGNGPRPIAGTWGDIGVLSFGGSKLFTAGRGGALLTRQPDLHQRRACLPIEATGLSPLGIAGRCPLPQLDKLDARNAARARAVGLLAKRLHSIPGLRLFANRLRIPSQAITRSAFSSIRTFSV